MMQIANRVSHPEGSRSDKPQGESSKGGERMLEVLLNLLLSIIGDVAVALIIQAIAPKDGKAPERKPKGKHYRR